MTSADAGAGGSGAGGSGLGGAMGEFAGATGSVVDGGSRCVASASSTLPGVSLGFFNVRCTYTQAEAAAGVQFDYELTVASDLFLVHPESQDLGHCQQPGISGLIVGFSIGGDGQRYCLCDVGPCPFQQPFSTSPRAGTYDDHIVWDGRNWGGPSDTSQPKGAPFPPGTYELGLLSTGTFHDPTIDGGVGGQPPDQVPYRVVASRTFTVTP